MIQNYLISFNTFALPLGRFSTPKSSRRPPVVVQEETPSRKITEFATPRKKSPKRKLDFPALDFPDLNLEEPESKDILEDIEEIPMHIDKPSSE